MLEEGGRGGGESVGGCCDELVREVMEWKDHEAGAACRDEFTSLPATTLQSLLFPSHPLFCVAPPAPRNLLQTSFHHQLDWLYSVAPPQRTFEDSNPLSPTNLG